MCAQGRMSLVAIETGEEDSMISRHLMNIPGIFISIYLDSFIVRIVHDITVKEF